MADCLFCRIVDGDIPSTRIYEDDRTVAFMDVNPGSHGPTLVVPKKHAKDLLEIDADDLAACTRTAQELARRAFGALGADGVNLLNCCGAAAWQTVFHFHLHVIPRYADDPARDRLQLPWVPQPGDPADIAAAAEALRGAPPSPA
jgi:histidine triad (HIT) family protein